MVNTISVTLSGVEKSITLRPFQAKEKKDGSRNTYYQIALPRKDGTTYPAQHGVSPVRLPHGLTTKVSFEGHAVALTPGRTQKGNAKATGMISLEVDGRPMEGHVEISDLGNGNYWLRLRVTNVNTGGFKAKTPDEVEALVFGQ
jgi:hypothetical protein